MLLSTSLHRYAHTRHPAVRYSAYVRQCSSLMLLCLFHLRDRWCPALGRAAEEQMLPRYQFSNVSPLKSVCLSVLKKNNKMLYAGGNTETNNNGDSIIQVFKTCPLPLPPYPKTWNSSPMRRLMSPDHTLLPVHQTSAGFLCSFTVHKKIFHLPAVFEEMFKREPSLSPKPHRTVPNVIASVLIKLLSFLA